MTFHDPEHLLGQASVSGDLSPKQRFVVYQAVRMMHLNAERQLEQREPVLKEGRVGSRWGLLLPLAVSLIALGLCALSVSYYEDYVFAAFYGAVGAFMLFWGYRNLLRRSKYVRLSFNGDPGLLRRVSLMLEQMDDADDYVAMLDDQELANRHIELKYELQIWRTELELHEPLRKRAESE